MATLYCIPGHFRTSKILIAAKCSGAPIFTIEDTPPGKKSDNFLKDFPLGKLPAFRTADGDPIFESNAIAEFVSNGELSGDSILEKSQVRQWMDFCDLELIPALSGWLYPVLGIIPKVEEDFKRAKETTKMLLEVLNKRLLARDFLVGQRLSLADISLISVLVPAYRENLFTDLADLVNLNRWFWDLVSQSAFRDVLGKLEEMGSPKTPISPPQEIVTSPSQKVNVTPARKKRNKSPKQRKSPLGKSPKPKLPSAEDDFANPESTRDPFAGIPKGSFKMDEFKRVYSNEAASIAIEYFWNKFDKQHYSIWYSEYKYPKELKEIYMSCNLVGGMFQRLDKMRKNAFASVLLFGSDNDSTISGLWVWRGQELAFLLSSDWQVDYESYTWTKLDPKEESTKKLVEEYLSWAGEFGGKVFSQGKIFK